MTEFDAKRLPVGSVIANDRQAWIKLDLDYGLGRETWICTTGTKYTDCEVTDVVREQFLADFDGPTEVLRVGSGSSGSRR